MDESGHSQFRRRDWPFVRQGQLEELRRIDSEVKRLGSPFRFNNDGENLFSSEDAAGVSTNDVTPLPIRARITGQYNSTTPWYSFSQGTFFNASTSVPGSATTFTYAGGFDDSATFNAVELNQNASVPFGSDSLGNDTGAIAVLWPLEDGQSWGFFYSQNGITTTDAAGTVITGVDTLSLTTTGAGTVSLSGGGGSATFNVAIGSTTVTPSSDSVQINTATPIKPFNLLNLVAGSNITLTLASDTPSAGTNRGDVTISSSGSSTATTIFSGAHVFSPGGSATVGSGTIALYPTSSLPANERGYDNVGS